VSARDGDGHAENWISRLQDALDDALVPEELGAVRAHLEACPECRALYATLTALDGRLRAEFATEQALDANFSARLAIRIHADEAARIAAKRSAEQAFRKRKEVLVPDWRELSRRHFGSVLAAIAAFAAVLGTLGSLWEASREAFDTSLRILPFIPSAATLPVALAMATAAAAFFWLRSKPS
jgi:anti-sigma factor RsiW